MRNLERAFRMDGELFRIRRCDFGENMLLSESKSEKIIGTINDRSRQKVPFAIRRLTIRGRGVILTLGLEPPGPAYIVYKPLASNSVHFTSK